MVMPLTTPSAKVSAKIFTQKRYAAIQRSSPVLLKRSWKSSSSQPSEMLMVGNKMWNVMLAANCTRASTTGSSDESMQLLRPGAGRLGLDGTGRGFVGAGLATDGSAELVLHIQQLVDLGAQLHQLLQRRDIQFLDLAKPARHQQDQPVHL